MHSPPLAAWGSLGIWPRQCQAISTPWDFVQTAPLYPHLLSLGLGEGVLPVPVPGEMGRVDEVQAREGPQGPHGPSSPQSLLFQ